VPLRIAFDLDGVFADMEGELARHAEVLFGEAVPRRDPRGADERTRDTVAAGGPAETPDGSNAAADAPPDEDPAELTRLRMTSKQTRRLWRHVQTVDNFWGSLEELEPGVLARLAALTAERRWEVIFLTKRPECAGATSQVQSQRWLESKGFPLPSVFVVQGSRGRIADALDLDFVVDDRPENCLDVVVDSKARAILVWRDDEKHLPAAARRLGIGVVRSVSQCLDILADVDGHSSDRPSIVERFMRLLGLKERTA
jgi:hypothetical protein